MFSKEERLQCNVSGKCKKEKLDVKRMTAIKNVVFRMFPPGPSEVPARSLGLCICAIDSASRALASKAKKENNLFV